MWRTCLDRPPSRSEESIHAGLETAAPAHASGLDVTRLVPAGCRWRAVGMTRVNGVRLFYELSGTGEVSLVLVHGSWVGHRQWTKVSSVLAGSCRVLTYDRRGHSDSEQPSGQGSVHEDVADLAALIEHLGLVPAFVAGNSFGGSIALRLAAARPDLLRGVIAHEPPLFALLAGDPALASELAVLTARGHAVLERLRAGDHVGAARQFVDTVALGPGAWRRLPPHVKQIFITNAPTFLDEAQDPDQLSLDLDSLRQSATPTLLTLGEHSPASFAAVVSKLAQALGLVAERQTFPGAGHLPHLTHPDTYIKATTAFIANHDRPLTGS